MHDPMWHTEHQFVLESCSARQQRRQELSSSESDSAANGAATATEESWSATAYNPSHNLFARSIYTPSNDPDFVWDLQAGDSTIEVVSVCLTTDDGRHENIEKAPASTLSFSSYDEDNDTNQGGGGLGRIEELNFSPSGKYLAVGWYRSCQVWMVHITWNGTAGAGGTGLSMTSLGPIFTQSDCLNHITFGKNDTTIATTARQDHIHLWELDSSTLASSSMPSSATCHQPVQSWSLEMDDDETSQAGFWLLSRLAWSPDGKTIFVGGTECYYGLQMEGQEPKLLVYLDVELGGIKRQFDIPKEIHDLVVSPNGKLLAIQLEGATSTGEPMEDQVWIWDIEHGCHLHTIPVERARLAWLGDNQTIACVFWREEQCVVEAYEWKRQPQQQDEDDSHDPLVAVWSHSFEDREPKSYNAAAVILQNPSTNQGATSSNGIVVFGGGLECVALVQWRLPTLLELCRQMLEQDPHKDQWPPDVVELIHGC